MKKLTVLILVLILAFAAMGAMAEDCAHDGEKYFVKGDYLSSEYVSIDDSQHGYRSVFNYVEYCQKCGLPTGESRTGYDEEEEPLLYSHDYDGNGFCSTCEHECLHTSDYVTQYTFDWYESDNYYEIEGDNLEHFRSTTGPCTVNEVCPHCRYVFSSNHQESATEEGNQQHNYDENGECYNCGHTNTCAHEYVSGYCEKCGTYCPHNDLDGVDIEETENEPQLCYIDGFNHAEAVLKKIYQTCKTCGLQTPVRTEIVEKTGEEKPHSYDDYGYCVECGYHCEHEYVDGKCRFCRMACDHSWYDAEGNHTNICRNCGYVCTQHDWDPETGSCKICYTSCEHQYTDGVCSICGFECIHNYNPSNGICQNCGYLCPHTNTYGAAEEEEYIWIDAETHQYRKYQKLYCNDCQSTAPVGTNELINEKVSHTFDGDTCSTCGYSMRSNIQIPEYPDSETLVINGSGAIPNYTSADPAPWADTASDIRRIIIDKDITAIGAYAFAGFDHPDLRVEFLQGSAPVIDEDAFAGRTEKVVC